MTMKKFFDIILYAVATLLALSGCAAAAWFFPWQLAVGVLTLLLGASCFYLWRFSKIIMILEGDLGKAIESLEEVEESMENIISMKLYFDTPEVQELVSHVMESVRMAKFSVNKMIKDFTDRSKQKFVMVVTDNEEEEDEQRQQQAGDNPMLRAVRADENIQQQQIQQQQQQEGTIARGERTNI